MSKLVAVLSVVPKDAKVKYWKPSKESRLKRREETCEIMQPSRTSGLEALAVLSALLSPATLVESCPTELGDGRVVLLSHPPGSIEFQAGRL